MFIFFFFNDTATTEIYTLSLHDALPILARREVALVERRPRGDRPRRAAHHPHDLLGHADDRPLDARLLRHALDRKSTRLNSSHANISYAVFCLKKKKTSERPATYLHFSR